MVKAKNAPEKRKKNQLWLASCDFQNFPKKVSTGRNSVFLFLIFCFFAQLDGLGYFDVKDPSDVPPATYSLS